MTSQNLIHQIIPCDFELRVLGWLVLYQGLVCKHKLSRKRLIDGLYMQCKKKDDISIDFASDICNVIAEQDSTISQTCNL